MKKKILVILLILIFLYCIGGVVYSIVVRQKNDDEVVKTNIITIDNYDYKLNSDKETPLYKEEFNNLKSNLESTEINIDNYISSVAKLYIIDLYTLSTKNNKYDITSNQYIYSSGRENYELRVSETLYKFIEDNSNGERKQELPEVSEIIIKSSEESTYLIGSSEYQAYIINIEWLYKKDLGYDSNAVLTLINDNGIISVVNESRVMVDEGLASS